VLRFALEVTGFRSERARLILEQCSNKSLLSSGFLRKFELWEARIRVVRPLLEFGADVHARDGLALVFATQSVDLELLNIVISSNPTIPSRRKAFQVTLSLRREGRASKMTTLLLQARLHPGYINAALVEKTRAAAANSDMRFVKLFSDNGVSIDFNKGEAI